MLNDSRSSVHGFRETLPFYLFAIAIFLILISQAFLSDGLFLDGLIYGTVAKNMAHGVGTFWDPHFTTTYLNHFHEHPPLGIGIQSIFFRILGDSRYTERIYSLLTFIITGFLLLKTWKTLGFENGWLPLLLWLITPTVSWACTSNILENTLTIFTTLSVLLYLRSINHNRFLLLFLSGFMLALAFLTKGFIAFFPFAFPFLFYLFKRERNFFQMIIDSAVMFCSAIIPLLLLLLFSPAAKESITQYLEIQVIASLESANTVATRFYIFQRLCAELAPMLLLCESFFLFARMKKFTSTITRSGLRDAAPFLLIGLAGVAPIMISLKQRGFYTLATYPWFAIGFAILIYPLVISVFSRINFRSAGFTFFRMMSFAFLVTGITLCIYFSTTIGRDKTKLEDCYTVIKNIPEGSTINIDPRMAGDWSLHGYYQRLKSIDLDPDHNHNEKYLLIENGMYSDSLKNSYSVVDLRTSGYKLLKRKNYVK
jgi:4-amino-4-deoxy-L-arabinose transferase-like glycosyltransferase